MKAITSTITKTVMFCVASCVITHSSSIKANDWADDWLSSNAAYSGVSSYKGGARNFITAGNLQFRANSSISYPVSMSAPRLKGGCGGVDLFLGGMSFMDVDMLVDKFEEMIQNGEVIAFQLAIKALSEKLGVTTESIQNVMDMLNSIQLDSCAMAKSAITTVVDTGSVTEAAKEVWSEISQGQELNVGAVKNAWQKGKNDATSQGRASAATNIKQEIAACPAEIKQILEQDGSVIERITNIYGMGAYSDFIRGYVGDVITDHDPIEGNMPMVKKISNCSQNEALGIDDLVYGRSFEKRQPTGINDAYTDPGQGCTQPAGSVNLVDYSRNQLTALAAALRDPANPLLPTSPLARWADNAPMSVKSAMKLANDAGITQQVIEEMSETLAYAYAFRIFDDMYRNTLFMFSTINDKLSSATADPVQEATNTISGSPAPRCNLSAYVVTIQNLSGLRDEIASRHSAIKESYIRQNEQMQAQISQISRYQQMEKRKFVNAGGY
ncbi:conjugal transfer protein TraH [Thalassotalea marina]|uniref:Pilus assembly protein n=1 Tax=Thalassotalea marina TaxID=1673741 RepID=A0A919BQW8_9GAMM|nr:conjugal transfer protein TraH [Thalassotalea marina]GHG07123.1 pilus assembly protein [Thalassotalea marina]